MGQRGMLLLRGISHAILIHYMFVCIYESILLCKIECVASDFFVLTMTTVNSPRPEFLEPLDLNFQTGSPSQDEQSPTSESVDLSSHNTYMEEHYYAPERAAMKERAAFYLAQEYNSLSFWEHRLDMLLRLKWPYVKKRGWSADDLRSVEILNESIEEAEKRIQDLQCEDDEDYDEYECECDSDNENSY